jgi:proteasome-associated ATPase
VLLNNDLNLLVDRAPWGSSPVGETAEFQRFIDSDRIALKWRDEEFIAELSESLQDQALKEGDLVRWQREHFLAIERIERTVTRRYFLEDVPDANESQVGGQRAALSALKAALISILADPGKAATYQLSGRQTVLLVGPPGCGKTLMARVAAAASMRISGQQCHFAVVKPAEWEDPYVGGTQANIRRCFEALREQAGEDKQVVVFMDEIEAGGRIRGHLMGLHNDKFVAALLAELDGFTARGGVAIIAATNRKDLVDPALLERLSDVEIEVPRPNIRAAEEIFEVHLSDDLPFSPNGSAAFDTRAEIINVALARLYNPNGDNALCVIKFRDGSQRTVTAGELMSGRLIQQICRSACQRAFLRDVTNGEPGIQVSDIEEAVADAIDRLSTNLTRHNVRSYLSNLPQDMDIIGVEPVVRRVRRTHRFLNI